MTDPLLFSFGVGMHCILGGVICYAVILNVILAPARMQEVSKYILIGTNAYLKSN